jgi:hypothetical protein
MTKTESEGNKRRTTKEIAELAVTLGIDVSKVKDWDKGSGEIGSDGWGKNPIERQKEYVEMGLASETLQYSAKILLTMEPPETYPLGVNQVMDILMDKLKDNGKRKIKYLFIPKLRPLTNEEKKEWDEAYPHH